MKIFRKFSGLISIAFFLTAIVMELIFFAPPTSLLWLVAEIITYCYLIYSLIVFFRMGFDIEGDSKYNEIALVAWVMMLLFAGLVGVPGATYPLVVSVISFYVLIVGVTVIVADLLLFN